MGVNLTAFLLLIGFLLRLITVLTADANLPVNYGGDALWFMAYGYGYFTFDEFGFYNNLAFTTSNIPTPPLYLIFVGMWLHLLPTQADAIMMIWLIQTLVGTAICALAYGIALDLTQKRPVALIVLVVHVFSLPMITDVSLIMTEPIYIFFIYAGLWLYGRFVLQKGMTWWLVMMVGVALGLATLTRAVSLMVPVLFILHLIITKQGGTWQRAIKASLILLFAYTLVLGTWTAHNWFYFGRFIVASDQFMPAIWRGTVEIGVSPQESDERLADTTPQAEVVATLTGDLGGYLLQRSRQLLSAVLEPYSVAYIGGDVSMRQLMLAWLQSPFDLGQLWTLLANPNFWIKLYVYILHYASLLAMPLGVWFLRRRWHMTSILLAFIAYTLAIHFITLAIPRYIFPTYSALWILSAIVYYNLWQKLQGRFQQQVVA